MVLFELFISYGIFGLLIISLISSIIPIPTEPIVFGLLDIGENPEIIFLTLIAGSILGASIGYLLGKYELRKIIPFHDKEKERQMQVYFRQYGALFLLMSPWIPVVGDLAPMVAGIENYEYKRFLIVISIAKIIKSIGIVYLSIRLLDWWMLFIK
ncbi:MAG: VTT domain-containing protein [Candidatus Methanoperedens sp.]|nr:VTT domain-containing protein [Candidatus Methanoperedens sp.]MCE8429419.1 VTT domain-containing protein [Candidatus Methanoperedens sp.]